MKKVILSALLLPTLAFSQLGTGYVGLNTATPNATLDINGVPNDTTKFDGVIAPRITGEQLIAKTYGTLQTGAIVYVTTIPTTLTGQVINVNEVGYYYFNGTVWKSFEDDTLADVVRRGNYSPNWITFISNGGVPSLNGALGMRPTYSMHFGNMNQAQTGFYNMAFGYNVFPLLTTGGYNSAFGHNSGASMTTASYSSLFGYFAGTSITTGNGNSIFGDESAYRLIAGHKNTYMGMGSAYHSTGGRFNSIFGYKAGQFRNIGDFNVMLGNNAGSNSNASITTIGNNNVLIGSGAGFNDVDLNNKLVIHSNSTLSTGDSNSVATEGIYTNPAQSQYANALITGDFQERSMRINGSIQVNPTLIKTATADYTKTLVFNPITGDIASGENGSTDDTLGDVVLRDNHSPKPILFVDEGGNDYLSVGGNINTYSMWFGNLNPNHTGIFNLGFGYNALDKVTTGSNNSATAPYSLSNLTTGYKNVANGYSAGQNLTTGRYNTLFGASTGFQLTTHDKNTFIGSQAGAYIQGNNNVFIGIAAGRANSVTTTETVNNRLVIHSNVALVPREDGENPQSLESSYTNGLIIGDFAQRWLRINGSMQINPALIKTATSDYTNTLLYNPTTGDIGAGVGTGDFLTRAGTVDRPITGELEFASGGRGIFSQTATKEIGFTTSYDDEDPTPIIYNTNKNTGQQTKIELQAAGIYLTGEILGDSNFPTPSAANSLVQREWVLNQISSTITVPAPPASGNYVLTSVNGVMQWVAN